MSHPLATPLTTSSLHPRPIANNYPFRTWSQWRNATIMGAPVTRRSSHPIVTPLLRVWTIGLPDILNVLHAIVPIALHDLTKRFTNLCQWLGAFLRWGRGGMYLPDSLVVPDSKASWPFWRDFWGPKMLQNPNFPKRFSKTPSWWGGARCIPLSRTLLPLSALRVSFLQVSGSNPLQSWQPY